MEEQIKFSSGNIRLAGSLQIPDSNEVNACVLLIAGSGQVDRNENHKKLHVDALRQIAIYLAKHKIASLRYDKRGVGESDGDYWETGFFDNISDAENALKYLELDTRLVNKPHFVLGHSEGALIAANLAAAYSDLSGAVLIAGAAQDGRKVIEWQAKEVAKGLTGLNGFLVKLLRIDVVKAQKKVLDKIEKSTSNWFRQGLVKKINAKWMREFLAYDPSKDLAKIRVPILAITGS